MKRFAFFIGVVLVFTSGWQVVAQSSGPSPEAPQARKVLVLRQEGAVVGPRNRIYRSSDLGEVQAFIKTHRKQVFVFGSTPLTADFEAALLEGIQRERSSVKVITSASALPRLKALIQAGALVRYRAGESVSRSGYANSVAIFEDRWLLLRAKNEWQLIDSVETVAQVKSRFEQFWAYCTLAK